MDVALLLKMNSLVYIHPENQFYAPDTDYKIPVSLGTNVFVTVSHDVTHNLPYNLVSVSKLQNTSCSDEFIFDNCVRDVSNSKGRYRIQIALNCSFKELSIQEKFSLQNSQQAEAISNKVLGPRNKNYPGVISMLQGFQQFIE